MPRLPKDLADTPESQGERTPQGGLMKPRRSMMALESRIVFDGALAADVALANVGLGAAQDATGVADAPALAAVPVALAPTRDIVFINASLPEWQKLADSAAPGAEVILIDAFSNGVEQISAVLQQRTDVGAIHIMTHGGEGYLLLGDTVLSSANLAQYGADLTAIGAALAPGGDILLYGCDVADGDQGQDFVSRLAELTGADVAASDDTTGAGGDWELEYRAGVLETRSMSPIGYGYDLATYMVTSLDDSGAGTLREIVGTANADGVADTIVFDPSLFTAGAQTITLTTGEMDIAGDDDADAITIVGPGAHLLTISGDNNSRIFSALGSGSPNISPAVLSGMTLTNGVASGGYGGGAIAAIYSGRLTLDNMIISNNTANYGGGGVFTSSGGGLVIRNSSFTGNSSGYEGGGLQAYSDGDDITITNSTFSGNTSVRSGGGLYLTGPSTTITLSNLTVDSNTANSSGFAGGMVGGGLSFGSVASASLINSTITRNSILSTATASGGGGLGMLNSTGVTVTNNIIADNSTAKPYNAAHSAGNGSDIFLRNSIVGGSNNIFTGIGLYKAQPGGAITSTNNMTGTISVLPTLGALVNNGGLVETRSIDASGSADNAGTATGAPTVDGRGYVRGGSIDIGAYEVSNAGTFNFSGSLFPANGFIDVPASNNLIIDFGQAVTAVVAHNIVIHNADNSIFETIPVTDGRVTIGAGAGGANSQVTINPTGNFAGGAGYYVLIDAGAFIDDDANIFNGMLLTTTWAFTSIAAASPTVTDARVSISGATGTGGAYKIGDTITATWNNTAGGDNNAGVTGVTVDFSQFGGGAAVAATNSSDTWSATYTITAGAIDAGNRNVSVTATNGDPATTADTSNATVDSIAPVVSNASISISGASGTGGAFKIGDTVTATWDNSAFGDDNSDSISGATVDFSAFGGGAAVVASNNSDTWSATYTITAGAIDAGNRNVSVTATDNAGNTTTTADTSNATVDSIAPVVSNASIGISGASGSGGAFKIGDTVTATWDNS
ncbi:MAG TPA: DUF4347 domain-containing protein, partial [Pseudomonas sp.]|nr:DUF4347 domain-containing protein [Pseudomonas sp.]